MDANAAAARALGCTRESLIGVELGLAGSTRGALVTLPRPDGRFTMVRLRLCTPLGERLLVVAELTRSERPPAADLARQLQEELTSRILGGADLNLALEHLCQGLLRLGGFPAGGIELVEPGEPIRAGLQITAGGESIPVSPEAFGLTGRVIETGTLTWRPELPAGGLRPCLTVPVRTHGRICGAMAVCLASSAGGTATDLAWLTELASALAPTLLLAMEVARGWAVSRALDSAANAMVLTDRAGQIRWVNSAWCRLTGYGPEEALGNTLRMIKSGIQSDEFYRVMWQTIASGKVWEGELYNRRKDGTIYLDEQTITPILGPAGSVEGYIAVKKDGTERSVQNEQLRYMLMHDPLTNLPNREALRAALERVTLAASGGEHGALLLLDLDHFRTVNEAVGYAAADEVLVAAATRLRRALRPSDLLVRVGGGEFAAVLEGVNPSQCWDLAERLRQAVAETPFGDRGHAFHLTISVGVVPLDGGLNVDSAMGLAYSALMEAKEQGRNQIVYRHKAKGDVTSPESWAQRIRAAMAEERFVLHFQPVVHLTSGRVDYHEVLIRLRSESGQLIPPGEFLAAAEQAGLMPEIDRWVVGRVLERIGAAPRSHYLVNLSGQSLDSPPFLTYLESLLTGHAAEAKWLTLEVTETTGISDVDGLRRWMQRVQEVGCRFALDDFGVGFSSFSYLRALPVDFVKLDGSFIRHLDTDATSRSLVQAITSVAHTLGKQVIAEWVESSEVARLLEEIGVEYGQGYLWGPPRAQLAG